MVWGSTQTIRQVSWLNCNRLRFHWIFLLTYDLAMGRKTGDIADGFCFSSGIFEVWRQFTCEVTLDFVEFPEKIDSKSKVVEIDESKFKKRN
ncbi:hypothetical protein TNCV_2092861 [Trichonephila clavipes]|nr:hypothetical protein TNCV_2092861 [Trichonephila clavipes]